MPRTFDEMLLEIKANKGEIIIRDKVRFHTDEYVALLNALTQSNNIETMVIGRVSLTLKRIYTLIYHCQNRGTLKKLSFSGHYSNKYVDESAPKYRNALFPMLRHTFLALESLRIKDMVFDEAAIEHLYAMLKSHTSRLKSLSLKRNNIQFNGLFQVITALKTNHTLEQLSFETKNTGDHLMATLANVLAVNKTLMVLKVRSGGVQAGSMKPFARALAKNTGLRILDLSKNKISTESAMILFEALKNNQTLTRLVLSFNNLDSAALIALAELLLTNKTLKRIDVSYNSIGDENIGVLVNALIENTTLRNFDIRGNRIIEGLTQLISVVEHNKTLRNFYFDSDSLYGEDKAIFNNILDRNDTLVNGARLLEQESLPAAIYFRNYQLQQLTQIVQASLNFKAASYEGFGRYVHIALDNFSVTPNADDLRRVDHVVIADMYYLHVLALVNNIVHLQHTKETEIITIIKIIQALEGALQAFLTYPLQLKHHAGYLTLPAVISSNKEHHSALLRHDEMRLIYPYYGYNFKRVSPLGQRFLPENHTLQQFTTTLQNRVLELHRASFTSTLYSAWSNLFASTTPTETGSDNSSSLVMRNLTTLV